MNVSLKTFLPTIAISAMALTSCDDNKAVERFADEYCLKHNKTEADFRNIKDEKLSSVGVSKLDSIVYRDIFNTTELAKDSAKIAEFNNIAASYRAPKDYSKDVISAQTDKAIEAGMLHEDFMTLTSYPKTSLRQNYLDNFAYKNFFKKNGVLTSDVENKCNEYSKKFIEEIK